VRAGRICFALLILVAPLRAPSRRATATVPLEMALQQVLDQRADALRRGDRAAFLSSVDEPFAVTEAARFDSARSAGFSDYSLRLRWDLAGDLSTAALRARFAPAPAVVGQVEVRLRFDGYETKLALTTDFLTFVERDGAWKVTSDIDLDGIGLLSSRELWDLGPVSRLESPDALVLSHPDGLPRAKDVQAGIESALARERAGLDIPWRGKVVVVLPSSSAELGRLLQSTVDLTTFVAFAYWGVDRAAPDGYAITEARIILNADTFFSLSPSVREDILTHELVHVATREKAGPGMSSWLDEGLADFVATGRGTASAFSDGQIPEDWRFGAGGADAVRDAYGRSRSFVAFLAARQPGVVAYYSTLGAMVAVPGSRERLQDDAARRVFGVPLAELRAQWARSS
jgi:hypothetical protein